MERENTLTATHLSGSPGGTLTRPKRAKSSKACNACRKQKSRCEKLAGDLHACHRCSVIGIPCVFPADPAPQSVRNRKPRPLLPAATKDVANAVQLGRPPTPQISPQSSGMARLRALADTTEMLSRPVSDGSDHRQPDSLLRGTPSTSSATPVPLPRSALSPETLSTVESTLFPAPRDPTSEAQSARVRADWRRWVAPLTLLQSLVRRNRPPASSDGPTAHRLVRPAENGAITMTQERRLKEHFRLHYLPWLPAVRFARANSPNCLDNVSPFLTTVICATAARTFPEVPATAIEHLRSLALHYVGQVFANPPTHLLVDSLYALLILVLWPLDAADDVALLINGAKQLSSAYERSRRESHDPNKPDDSDVDYTRLWYTICASETILNLGCGSPASPPPVDDLVGRLGGSASNLALESGCTSDVLLILQTSLHRIVADAMSEKGQRAAFKGGPPSLEGNGRESLLRYMTTVYMTLASLGEWDIEFHSISAEYDDTPSAVHFAALGIEYHYLRLMLVTSCLLTLCHACPPHNAPDEVKFALWSWSITGNKSAHAVVRLFNTHYTEHGLQHAPDRTYAMLVVAVMLILRHQVASYEYDRRRGAASSPSVGFTKQAGNAIRKAAARMGASKRPDHAASRYAEIMEALLRVWEEKHASEQPTHDEEAMHAGGFGDGDAQGESSVPQMELDLSLLGGDVFGDAVFPWDGFGSSLEFGATLGE